MCQVLDLVTRGVVKVSSCYRLTGKAILIIIFVASDGNKRALDIDCQCMNEHEVKNITPFELKLYLLKDKTLLKFNATDGPNYVLAIEYKNGNKVNH